MRVNQLVHLCPSAADYSNYRRVRRRRAYEETTGWRARRRFGSSDLCVAQVRFRNLIGHPVLLNARARPQAKCYPCVFNALWTRYSRKSQAGEKEDASPLLSRPGNDARAGGSRKAAGILVSLVLLAFAFERYAFSAVGFRMPLPVGNMNASTGARKGPEFFPCPGQPKFECADVMCVHAFHLTT